jgi:hypothetical protein
MSIHGSLDFDTTLSKMALRLASSTGRSHSENRVLISCIPSRVDPLNVIANNSEVQCCSVQQCMHSVKYKRVYSLLSKQRGCAQ